MNNDTVAVDKITLEKIRFAISQMVSNSVLEDMDYHSQYDILTDSFIKRLSLYLLSNKVNQEEHDDVVNVYPATMWEELKRDFCPQWLKRKFPVRYSRDIKHTTIKHYHVCPHLNVKTDRGHIDFMMLKDKMPDYEGT